MDLFDKRSIYDWRILIVEPEAGKLAHSLNLLGKQGLNVHGTRDLPSAMHLIRNQPVDLVVLLSGLNDREKDHLRNFLEVLKSGIPVIDHDGPVHLLPDHLTRIYK